MLISGLDTFGRDFVFQPDIDPKHTLQSNDCLHSLLASD